MFVIMSWCFPNQYIFKCCSESFLLYLCLRAVFEPSYFVLHVIHAFGLSDIFFLFPYFTPKVFICFKSGCWFILVRHFYLIIGRIFFFFFYRLLLPLYVLHFLSLAKIILFNSSSCTVRLVHCFLLDFSSPNTLVCFPYSELYLVVVVS